MVGIKRKWDKRSGKNGRDNRSIRLEKYGQNYTAIRVTITAPSSRPFAL